MLLSTQGKVVVVAVGWWLMHGVVMERIRMKDLEKFLKCLCVYVFVYMIISTYSTTNIA